MPTGDNLPGEDDNTRDALAMKLDWGLVEVFMYQPIYGVEDTVNL